MRAVGTIIKKIIYTIILTPIIIAVIIILYYAAYKGLEISNIYIITKESNKKLEIFLENYPSDKTLLQIYGIKQIVDNGYDSYEIKHIKSRNISDSELVVDVIYHVKLIYKEKVVKYEVIHKFTRFGRVELYLSKKELEDGTWIFKWKEL